MKCVKDQVGEFLRCRGWAGEDAMVTQMRATLPKGTILWDGCNEGMGQRVKR